MADFKYIGICPKLEEVANDLCLRLIRDEQPTKEDFIPHFYVKRKFNKEKECLAKGVSLFTDLKDIETMLELVPSLKNRYKSIYKGEIENKHGMLYKTPSSKKPSHKTFYAYKTCKEVDIFTKRVDYDF